jgi:hypothetical protein
MSKFALIVQIFLALRDRRARFLYLQSHLEDF